MKLTYKIKEESTEGGFDDIEVNVGGFGDHIARAGWFGYIMGKMKVKQDYLLFVCNYDSNDIVNPDGTIYGESSVDCAIQLENIIKAMVSARKEGAEVTS